MLIKPIPGYTVISSSGILAGADHFSLDHNDTTFETDYINRTIRFAVEVQVTQHAGSDSDKWLLHELESTIKTADPNRLGQKSDAAAMRNIGTNRVFWIGVGGGSFKWISNNVVVIVSYRDLKGDKPDPMEVVQAYLQKFPSTIPLNFPLNKTHDAEWIKNEMDRRLWLRDRWVLQIQPADAELSKKLKEIVDHINIFLDYREKCFGRRST